MKSVSSSSKAENNDRLKNNTRSTTPHKTNNTENRSLSAFFPEVPESSPRTPSKSKIPRQESNLTMMLSKPPSTQTSSPDPNNLPLSPSKIPQARRKSTYTPDSAKKNTSSPRGHTDDNIFQPVSSSSPRGSDVDDKNNENHHIESSSSSLSNQSISIPISTKSSNISLVLPQVHSASFNQPTSTRQAAGSQGRSISNDLESPRLTTRRASINSLLTMPSFNINTAVDDNEIVMQPKMSRRSSIRTMPQTDIGMFATPITVPPPSLNDPPKQPTRRLSVKNVLDGYDYENDMNPTTPSATVKGGSSTTRVHRSKNHSLDFIGVKEFMQRHGKQIKKFEQWSRDKNWKKFHTSHFDYWVFPLGDRTNFGLRYSVFEEEVFQFHKDKYFMKNYARGIELVALAWGWNIKGSCFVTKPDIKRGQQWSNWPIRLYRAHKSTVYLGLSQESESLQKYADILLDKGLPFIYNQYNLKPYFRPTKRGAVTELDDMEVTSVNSDDLEEAFTSGLELDYIYPDVADVNESNPVMQDETAYNIFASLTTRPASTVPCDQEEEVKDDIEEECVHVDTASDQYVNVEKSSSRPSSSRSYTEFDYLGSSGKINRRSNGTYTPKEAYIPVVPPLHYVSHEVFAKQVSEEEIAHDYMSDDLDTDDDNDDESIVSIYPESPRIYGFSLSRQNSYTFEEVTTHDEEDEVEQQQQEVNHDEHDQQDVLQPNQCLDATDDVAVIENASASHIQVDAFVGLSPYRFTITSPDGSLIGTTKMKANNAHDTTSISDDIISEPSISSTSSTENQTIRHDNTIDEKSNIEPHVHAHYHHDEEEEEIIEYLEEEKLRVITSVAVEYQQSHINTRTDIDESMIIDLEQQDDVPYHDDNYDGHYAGLQVVEDVDLDDEVEDDIGVQMMSMIPFSSSSMIIHDIETPVDEHELSHDPALDQSISDAVDAVLEAFPFDDDIHILDMNDNHDDDDVQNHVEDLDEHEISYEHDEVVAEEVDNVLRLFPIDLQLDDFHHDEDHHDFHHDDQLHHIDMDVDDIHALHNDIENVESDIIIDDDMKDQQELQPLIHDIQHDAMMNTGGDASFIDHSDIIALSHQVDSNIASMMKMIEEEAINIDMDSEHDIQFDLLSDEDHGEEDHCDHVLTDDHIDANIVAAMDDMITDVAVTTEIIAMAYEDVPISGIVVSYSAIHSSSEEASTIIDMNTNDPYSSCHHSRDMDKSILHEVTRSMSELISTIEVVPSYENDIEISMIMDDVIEHVVIENHDKHITSTEAKIGHEVIIQHGITSYSVEIGAEASESSYTTSFESSYPDSYDHNQRESKFSTDEDDLEVQAIMAEQSHHRVVDKLDLHTDLSHIHHDSHMENLDDSIDIIKEAYIVDHEGAEEFDSITYMDHHDAADAIAIDMQYDDLLYSTINHRDEDINIDHLIIRQDDIALDYEEVEVVMDVDVDETEVDLNMTADDLEDILLHGFEGNEDQVHRGASLRLDTINEDEEEYDESYAGGFHDEFESMEHDALSLVDNNTSMLSFDSTDSMRIIRDRASTLEGGFHMNVPIETKIKRRSSFTAEPMQAYTLVTTVILKEVKVDVPHIPEDVISTIVHTADKVDDKAIDIPMIDLASDIQVAPVVVDAPYMDLHVDMMKENQIDELKVSIDESNNLTDVSDNASTIIPVLDTFGSNESFDVFLDNENSNSIIQDDYDNDDDDDQPVSTAQTFDELNDHPDANGTNWEFGTASVYGEEHSVTEDERKIIEEVHLNLEAEDEALARGCNCKIS